MRECVRRPALLPARDREAVAAADEPGGADRSQAQGARSAAQRPRRPGGGHHGPAAREHAAEPDGQPVRAREAHPGLDNGDVEFRLKAYSRSATSGPLWLRLGFRLVGRRQQLAFYRNVCRRMRRLTDSQLEMADVTRREERWG